MTRYLKILIGVVLLCLTECPANRVFAQAVLINVNPTDSAPLVQAIEGKGLTVKTGAATEEIAPASRLIVWESKAGGAADITADRARQVGEIVRSGGSLLLTFDQTTGITPMRLACMLPTIPWHTQGASLSRGGIKPAVSALNWDTSFFPNNEPNGLSLPFHYEMEPVTSVERGMQRYDPFAYNIAAFDLKHEPGDFFWTRPLLNREWTVRLRGNDGPQTPLLITGRYGAGRVAVFAASTTSITSANQKMWTIWSIF